MSKLEENRCFFCDQVDNTSVLHAASTFNVNAKVRRFATKLQDRRLLTKLAGGYMISLEAHYHLNCVVSLYNRARHIDISTDQESDELSPQGVAFAEIISYIDDFL